MFGIRALAALTVTCLLGGCAGMSEQACLSSDWKTVGFQDGTLGRPVGTIGNYGRACADHGVTPDLEAYRAGHAEGVAVYCRASNGFGVGHSGAGYQGVCPANLEQAFVAEYNVGRHLYELESAVRDIDNQIARNLGEQDRIKKELTGIAARMVSADTSTEQRVVLVARTAELGKRYGELSAQNDTLKQERVGHAAELADYQQTLAARL
jgi:hypothetical protein